MASCDSKERLGLCVLTWPLPHVWQTNTHGSLGPRRQTEEGEMLRLEGHSGRQGCRAALCVRDVTWLHPGSASAPEPGGGHSVSH